MIKFRKYHGLGNDFIVVEGEADTLDAPQIVEICRRHRGVGADGILLVERGQSGRAVPEVRMVIYNRDGSRPEMCGNGVRCVAAFAHQYLNCSAKLDVVSDTGRHRCHVEKAGPRRWRVAVDMGPVRAASETKDVAVDGSTYSYVAVDVGNPHAVIFRKTSQDELRSLGAVLNDDHRQFPEGINVEFASPGGSEKSYEVAVYERGVGITRACGTGACAVAAAVWSSGRQSARSPLEINLPGGALTIENKDERVWMTGEAVEVFQGSWQQ